MKTLYINSYYSDYDTRDTNCSTVDGTYKVTYPDHLNLKSEIKNAYKRIQDVEDRVVCELSEVLEYLIGKGLELDYEITDAIKFDCDYGCFEE